jgi:hypothetical protein
VGLAMEHAQVEGEHEQDEGDETNVDEEQPANDLPGSLAAASLRPGGRGPAGPVLTTVPTRTIAGWLLPTLQ